MFVLNSSSISIRNVVEFYIRKPYKYSSNIQAEIYEEFCQNILVYFCAMLPIHIGLKFIYLFIFVGIVLTRFRMEFKQNYFSCVKFHYISGWKFSLSKLNSGWIPSKFVLKGTKIGLNSGKFLLYVRVEFELNFNPKCSGILHKKTLQNIQVRFKLKFMRNFVRIF